MISKWRLMNITIKLSFIINNENWKKSVNNKGLLKCSQPRICDNSKHTVSYYLSFYSCLKVNCYFTVQTKNSKKKVVQACGVTLWCVKKQFTLSVAFHLLKLNSSQIFFNRILSVLILPIKCKVLHWTTLDNDTVRSS